MTAGADPSVIDLDRRGEPGGPSGGPQLSPRLRRSLAAAVVAVLALGTGVGSATSAGTALGAPLWTGTVSLNGFTLGRDSVYLSTPDGATVIGHDLTTGRARWSVAVPAGELPERTADVGHGVAAVTTHRSTEAPDPPEFRITFIREDTGQELGQTSGYFFIPGEGSLPLIIMGEKAVEDQACVDFPGACFDVIAWDVESATVRWRRDIPSDSLIVPSFSGDGRFNGLAEMAADGTVRLVDLATGSVTGTRSETLPLQSGGTAVLTRDALVTALPTDAGVAVAAYRRPDLERVWSVMVPGPTEPVPADRQQPGGIQLTQCGSTVVCLYPDRLAGRIIETRTGAVTPPIRYELIQGVGNGLFLAASLANDSPSALRAGFVVDQTGRVRATLPLEDLVQWEDSGGRALITQKGPNRTAFAIIDGRGEPTTIGSVAEAGLSCQARGSYLACSDPAGTLRVWRLPAQ